MDQKEQVMPALYRSHDLRLGGDLAERLRAWAEAGESLQEIAWKLRDLEIEVTPPTVMRWMDRLGIARRHQRGEGEYNAPSNRGVA